MGNLTTGYFRDLQLLKEKYIYAFKEIKACLEIALLMVPNISVNKNININSGILFLMVIPYLILMFLFRAQIKNLLVKLFVKKA